MHACPTSGDEKEPDKGHKLVDYAGRCVTIPDDPAATPMATDDCVGNYEYMPDGSWNGTGTRNVTFKGGDKLYESCEEGSHLKEYSFKITGGAEQIRTRQRRRHVHLTT